MRPEVDDDHKTISDILNDLWFHQDWYPGRNYWTADCKRDLKAHLETLVLGIKQTFSRICTTWSRGNGCIRRDITVITNIQAYMLKHLVEQKLRRLSLWTS